MTSTHSLGLLQTRSSAAVQLSGPLWSCVAVEAGRGSASDPAPVGRLRQLCLCQPRLGGGLTRGLGGLVYPELSPAFTVWEDCIPYIKMTWELLSWALLTIPEVYSREYRGPETPPACLSNSKNTRGRRQKPSAPGIRNWSLVGRQCQQLC